MISWDVIHIYTHILVSCRGCFDVCDNDEPTKSPTLKVFLQPDTEQWSDEGDEAGRSDFENLGEGISQSRQVSSLSGSLVQDNAPPEKVNDDDR